MALKPHAQRKAQEELDRIVGVGRLPEYKDLDKLVYCKAVAMESLRWMPPLPLGVPHFSMEDDVYEGYFIPKGTTVIGNCWWVRFSQRQAHALETRQVYCPR